MSEIQWLEGFQRTLAFIMRMAAWEPYEAKEGITHKGTAVLPGHGEVTLYRLHTGEEILTEETMGALLHYTSYERLLPPQDEEDTVETSPL